MYNYGGIAGANQEADLAFFSQTAIQSIQKRGDILGAQWSKIIFEVCKVNQVEGSIIFDL